MKSNLLSIGQVSKLKGVGVKSLRYYERLGILVPAFVDPDTGYRYYSMQQMMDLDVVLTCIELGIPLKNLEKYQAGEEGKFDLMAFMEQGRSVAQQRIHAAQTVLMKIDTCLEEAEAQKGIARELRARAPREEGPGSRRRSGSPRSIDGEPYMRTMPKRTVLAMPLQAPVFDSKEYVRHMTTLYSLAKELGLVALYFQGLIGRVGEDGAACEWSSYLEVRSLDGETDLPAELKGAAQAQGVSVRVLDEGEFSGMRVSAPDYDGAYSQVFAREKKADSLLVVSEVWDVEVPRGLCVLELLEGSVR